MELETEVEDPDDSEPPPPPPTATETSEALLVARRFFESQPGADDDIRMINSLEDKIIHTILKAKRQTKLTEFF